MADEIKDPRPGIGPATTPVVTVAPAVALAGPPPKRKPTPPGGRFGVVEKTYDEKTGDWAESVKYVDCNGLAHPDQTPDPVAP